MIVGNITAKYTNKHIVHNIALDNIEKVIVETIDKTKSKFVNEFPKLKDRPISEKDIVNFIKLFPLQANEIVTQRLIADRPNTYWELLNVGTNVLSHHMNRNAESTHNLESMLYNKVKTWANA